MTTNSAIMRNGLREALHTFRRDLVAAAVTVALLALLTHYIGDFSWVEALLAAVAPLSMMLDVKLTIEGWCGPAELDPNDAELVDVHVDRRGRLHGSWRRRPQQ